MTNAIDQFLNNWRVEALSWYMIQFSKFNELFMVKKELQDKYGYHSVRFNQELADDYLEASENLKKFTKRFPENVAGTIQMMFYYENQYNINPSKPSAYAFISDILLKEMERKRKQLIARVEKKAGKIVDSTALSLGVDSNLNGVVIGDKETVRVNSIYAGGYNIQCLHFRILVKIIK